MYSERWSEAIKRTLNFGLKSELHFTPEPEKIYIPDSRMKEFNSVLQHIFKDFSSYEEFCHECMSVHLHAKDLISEWLSCPVYYTIGWLKFDDGEELYKFTEEDMRDLINNGKKGSTVRLHAWLTLPSYEIIDLTLTTTLCMQEKNPAGYGGILAKKADDVWDFAYMPMVIGEEYLEKIGAMKRFSFYE